MDTELHPPMSLTRGETMDTELQRDLQREYETVALETARASAEIAYHEKRAEAAKTRYAHARKRRDELKNRLAGGLT